MRRGTFNLPWVKHLAEFFTAPAAKSSVDCTIVLVHISERVTIGESIVVKFSAKTD
jgi:hypothetical protein